MFLKVHVGSRKKMGICYIEKDTPTFVDNALLVYSNLRM